MMCMCMRAATEDICVILVMEASLMCIFSVEENKNTNTYVQDAQGHRDSKLRIFSHAEVITVYFQLGRDRMLIFAKSLPQIRT